MAIDLQNPSNISTGWGPPPQFHAPEIGGLVGHILQNRILQRAQQDKEIADAIKNIQSQREDAAYTEALRNVGLTQGQDISGLSAADATRLATLVQANTPDAQRNALLAAQTAAINRGEGRGGSRGPRPFTQGQQFNALKTQASILGKQAEDIAGQQEDYGFGDNVPTGDKSFGYMKNPDGKSLRYAVTPEEQKNPDFMSPVDILSGAGKEQSQKGLIDKETGQPLAPIFTPKVYTERQEQSALRQKILGQQKDVQKKMLAPPTDGSAGGGGDGGGGGIDRLRTQAQDAIKQGAPADAVSQKFREMTGQEL